MEFRTEMNKSKVIRHLNLGKNQRVQFVIQHQKRKMYLTKQSRATNGLFGSIFQYKFQQTSEHALLFSIVKALIVKHKPGQRLW